MVCLPMDKGYFRLHNVNRVELCQFCSCKYPRQQNRSENCRKFSPANRRHHNWEPIHQSSMLRVTIDAIGQCG